MSAQKPRCAWPAAAALIIAAAGCSAAGTNGALPAARPDYGVQLHNVAQADNVVQPNNVVQPDSTQTMYVAGFYSKDIIGFPANSDGNVSPTVKISGNKTLLNGASALAVDPSSGKIFTANQYPDSRVLIFPKDANGNVAPKVLAGSNVQFKDPGGVAVGPSGELYVSDVQYKAIYVFAAGAHGNAAPIRTISGANTKLVAPCGMAFDSNGHLYVANIRDTDAPIEEFAANANGNVAPIATLGGNHVKLGGAYNVSLDRNDRIVVADGGQIKIFAAGAHGNVDPVAIIKGSATKLVDGTTVGTSSNSTIYVTNLIDVPNHKASILAFDSNANGNVAPLHVISGSQTGVFDTWNPSFL